MPRQLLRIALLASVCCMPTGCKTVWPIKAGGATAVGATAAAIPPGAPVAAANTPTGPFETLTEQQALQRVLPKLQHIAQVDPETHAKLLEQLAAADPSLWPDTVERAESTVRYRHQLAQKASGRSDVRVASNESPLTYDRPTATTTIPAATAPAAEVITPVAPSAPTRMPTAYPVTQPAAPHDHSSSHQPLRDNAVRQASAMDERPPQVIRNQYATNSHAADSAIRVASLATADQLRPSTPPVPHVTAPPTDWRASVEDAIETLSVSTSGTPHSRREAYELVRLRLLQLAAGDRLAAVAATPGLSSTEQSYWSKQLYAMSVLLDAEATPDQRKRAAQAAPHQAEALALVRELGPLQVRNLAFCKQVYGYGAYEPIEDADFEAGQHVKLYAEVDNYRSESTENGYHTLLATSYRVVDKHGGLVDSGEFPAVEDHCLTRRRDFHITYGVTLPTAIYAGDYELEITITDQLGDKIGTETVPFTIASR